MQDALNIEDGLDDPRYNNVVIATDADADGMLTTSINYLFLQFFPELIKQGHLHILQTPLFRVRNGRLLDIVIVMKSAKPRSLNANPNQRS